MSLFGDLPPLAKKVDGAKAKDEEDLDAKLVALNQQTTSMQNKDIDEDDNEGEARGNNELGAHADDDEETRPAKRVKFQDSSSSGAAGEGGEDQILVALRRIAMHIANPLKFEKANPLLRKIMDNAEALDSSVHSVQLFETIRAAFSRPSTVADPVNRRDFMKLVSSMSGLVEKKPSFFSGKDLAHLDVYRLMGHVQGELGTDDSFQFAKSLAKLREEVDDLSEATEEDCQALTRLCAEGPCWQAVGSALSSDAAPMEARSSAWSAVEVKCMKREALLSIIELTLKPIHQKQAWSRTGIELLIEHMHSHKALFCLGSQQDKVEDLMMWVRQQRGQRKKGPSAKEINRDSSSFDRDRKQWEAQDWISKNGKVGAGGDAKSNGWLG